jgi:hypothetical protein
MRRLTKCRLAIGDSYVHVMLLAVLIDREAFKGEISARAVMWFNRPREVKRGLHAQVCYAIFHDFEVDSDHSGHFNGTAKRDFAVALWD